MNVFKMNKVYSDTNYRIVVPMEAQKKLMEIAHSSSYTMHPGSTKMYKDIKSLYWWLGMKKEVADFIARCLTCQQVKAEHQKPAGLL